MNREDWSVSADDSGDGFDAEVGRLLNAYLADREAGRPADPERLCAEHPDLADRLRAGLDVLDLADAAAREPLDSPTWTWLDGPEAVDASYVPSLGEGAPSTLLLRDPSGGKTPLLRSIPASLSAGRYRLLGEIARGGMGAVLKGYDPELGRELVVKVLLNRHQGNPNILRRFTEEAQIGGQLQHPGIVPVYDVGSLSDRRPFFAMKLVQGRTLAALLAERPEPAHDRPRFLGIFDQVCQAMAYAHACGVIHRDLKPSNVMVGSFGEVQVMDWGLAKVLAEGGAADDARSSAAHKPTIRTARIGSSGDASSAGSVLGTPAYMAPEQARGEIERLDERSDVFGLGAILCEILTGAPPYRGGSAAEVRVIAERADLADALGRLSTCAAESELVELTTSCLEPEPSARPRSAGDVARRVRSYLSGVQERLHAAELARVEAQARAEEASRRAVVERQRRRYQLGLAAAVVLLLTIGGLSVSFWARQREAQAVRRQLAMNEARLLRDQALASADDVTKWEAAQKAIEAAAREQSGGGRPSAEFVALKDEVARGLAAARRDRTLTDALGDLRTGESDVVVLGTDDAYAHAFRDAGFDVDRAPAETGARIGVRPAAVVLAVVAALDDWARVRRSNDPRDPRWHRPLEAARAADRDPYRDRIRATLINPDAKTREAALRSLASDSRAAQLPAASAVLLASALRSHKATEAAVDLLRIVTTRHPEDVWANYALARTLSELRPAPREEVVRYYSAARALRPETAHQLAHCLDGMGRGEEALAVFADLVRRRPTDATALFCYARSLQSRGRGEAARLFDQVVSLAKQEVRRDPGAFVAHFTLANAMTGKGKLDEAIAEYQTALRLKPDNASCHINIGNALIDKGLLHEAIAEFRTALRLDPNLVEAHFNLANALRDTGKLDDAIAEFQVALELKPDFSRAHTNVGFALQDKGNSDLAVAAFREALRLKPDLPEAHYGLGNALRDRGDLDGAVAEFRRALQTKPDFAAAHCNLGLVLASQGLFRDALRELESGHKLGSRDSNWRSPSAHWLENARGMVALEKRLPAVLQGTDRPADLAETVTLAQICMMRKYFAAAYRLWSEAFAMEPKLTGNPVLGHRYNAACAAALAGTGQGKDDPPPDDAARAKLRAQALDWLKSELAAWSAVLKTDSPEARATVRKTLEHWQRDPDLSGLRDEAALVKLSRDEQAPCRALWADVEALITKARNGTAP